MSGLAPVVLLAFANDQGSYLQSLVGERKAIAGALREYDRASYLRLESEPNAGIDDLFSLFDLYGEQMVVFHYGGHASGTALKLETAGGGNETAHAGGLAAMMGLSKSLKLVFLNGCATHDQVKALLAAGVPAVIATAVAIDDTSASEFAAQFYATLGSGATIGDAFKAAQAKLQTRDSNARQIGDFRGIEFDDDPAKSGADSALTWGLYTAPGQDPVRDWTLPRVAETQVVIRSSPSMFPGAAGPVVNDQLVETLFNALARYNPSVLRRLEQARAEDLTDDREIRTDIVDCLPSPVGEHIRKLYSLEDTDIDRLRQLAMAYEVATKFVAFAIASQLWNERFANPTLTVSAEQWAAIDAFRQITPEQEAGFDYVATILTGIAVFEANGRFPFMSECAGLPEKLENDAEGEARGFLKQLRERLAAGDPGPGEVPQMCLDAEHHLATFLATLAFIAGYKLATIKQIAIAKSRNQPARFFHSQVVLDRVSMGFKDTSEVATAYTDNQSVVLFKTLTNFGDYLNLSPFIIDQNALRGQRNSQIYFLRTYDPAARAANFHLIDDPTRTLVISTDLAPADQPLYLPVRDLIVEFGETMVPY